VLHNRSGSIGLEELETSHLSSAVLHDPMTPTTQHNKVEQFLSNEKSKGRKTESSVKILLLGLNGSGKSTIINKLKEYISETSGSDDSISETNSELNKTFRDIIHFHALNGIKQLILASEKLDIPILPRHSDQKEEIEQAINFLRILHFRYGEHVLDPQVASMMKLIWEQRGSKEIHSEFLEFQSQNKNQTFQQTTSQQRIDTEEEDFKAVAVKASQQFNAGEINCFTLYKDLYNLHFFMENIDRIAQSDYIPTNEDVQYCQSNLKEEKKGIEEIEFSFSGGRYTIYCVEGQNNDGRKWLFLFQGIDIVLFLCPIGDYDAVPPTLDRRNIVRER